MPFAALGSLGSLVQLRYSLQKLEQVYYLNFLCNVDHCLVTNQLVQFFWSLPYGSDFCIMQPAGRLVTDRSTFQHRTMLRMNLKLHMQSGLFHGH